MEITYELIQSLVISAEADGSKMVCEFEVPESQEVIPSSAMIKRDKSVAGQIKQRVTRTVTSRARVSTSRLVRNILGGGMLGRIGSQAVNTATRGVTQDLNRGYSSDEKEAAIVEAFSKVAKHFHYDDVLGWQKAGAIVTNKQKVRSAETKPVRKQVNRNASEFEKLVQKNTITNSFEKEVLARLLVEVAQADGGISSDEEQFLQEFIPDYEAFLQKPLLTPIECEEISKSSKLTIYAIAWVVALIDLEMNPLEEAKLFELGDWFELNDRTVDSTINTAKSYILEQNITLDSSNEDAITVGKLLGFTDDESLRAFIKFKKRMG